MYTLILNITKMIKSTDPVYKSGYGSYRTLMHSVAAAQFFYGIYFFQYFVTLPDATFAGKFQYLTFLDAVRNSNMTDACIIS